MTQLKNLPNRPRELQAMLEDPNIIPPVETWNPQRIGEGDITIRRDGVWLFKGEPMTREATVQLFSRILIKEGNEYFLVTPVEKMRLQVELYPFVIRLMDVQGEGEDQKLLFSTNAGDTFEVNAEHALRTESLGTSADSAEESLPVVTVRRNLDALVSRQVYYELANLVTASTKENVTDGEERYGVWSCGSFFEL